MSTVGRLFDQYDDYKLLAPSPFQGEANGNTVTLVNTAAGSVVYGGEVEGMDVFGAVRLIRR